MNFAKIGNEFINLDHIKRAIWNQDKLELEVHFSSDSNGLKGPHPDVVVYKNATAHALYTLLDKDAKSVPLPDDPEPKKKQVKVY